MKMEAYSNLQDNLIPTILILLTFTAEFAGVTGTPDSAEHAS